MKFSRFFAFASSLALLAGCATDRSDDGCTKVLMIGNSFSISLMSNLPQVAESLEVPLDVTSLYIGGCSLERHVQNLNHAQKDEDDLDDGFAPYQLKRAVRGEYRPQEKVNLPEILNGTDEYDIITIQQASHFSWCPETYSPAGEELIAAIRKAQPKAKIYVQETWSYTPWDKRLKTWGIDQNEMYAKLKDAYAAFAKRNGLDEIRMGTAIQEWRKRLPVKYSERSFGGDVVGGRSQKGRDQFKRSSDNKWMPICDVFHLNEQGEYFQALVWAAKLFGKDVTKCAYRPDCVTEENAELMKEIANELK